jgi:hypothetical protein
MIFVCVCVCISYNINVTMETYAKIEKCQKQIQGIVTYETYIHSLSSKTHTHTYKYHSTLSYNRNRK